jgi:hypothetical protein
MPHSSCSYRRRPPTSPPRRPHVQLVGASPSHEARTRDLHLADAFETASEPRARALSALDCDDAPCATHRYQDAVRAFDWAIKAARDTNSKLALRIEAHAMAAARLHLGTYRLVTRRLKRLVTSRRQPRPAG